jgi:DNA-binding NarL/FixJ family response regulator
MTVGVVVADDNVLVREGLRLLVASEPGYAVLACCASLDELMAAVERHDPQLVVTDIRMPPTMTDEGIRAARALRESHPGTGVLVLSQFVGASYALALLDEGSRARGYLLKDRVTDPDRLWSAVRAVVAGGSYIDDAVIDALVAGRRHGAGSPLELLSPREAEILTEVARGCSNAAIAAHLRISVRAVEKHVSSIFFKLDVPEDGAIHRRVKAALLALRYGAPGSS